MTPTLKTSTSRFFFLALCCVLWTRAARADCSSAANWAAKRSEIIGYLDSAPGAADRELKSCIAQAEAGKKDAALLTVKAKLKTCFGRLQGFVAAVARPGLGLDVSNDEFHRRHAVALGIPAKLAEAELFRLLQEVALSDVAKKVDTVKNAVDHIKGLYPQAIVVPYVSSTTPSVDNNNAGTKGDRYGRIVVAIEDGGLTKYIQFSVNTVAPPSDKPIERVQASVVNFDKVRGAYVFDWKRDNTTHKFTYDPSFGNNQKCYQCHMSGVLAIHPFEPDEPNASADVKTSLGPKFTGWLGFLNKKYRPEVTRLNALILNEYKTNKPGVIDAPSPAIAGSQVPNIMITPRADSAACTKAQHAAVAALKPAVALTEAQVKQDGKNYAASWIPFSGKFWDYKPLKPNEPPAEAYRCTSCHNDRGNALVEFPSMSDILQKYIHSGYMPPSYEEYQGGVIARNQADDAQRKLVADCFVNDYFDPVKGRLAAWLTLEKCNQ